MSALINMLIMKRFYTAMSLVAVLLYMASLSLATTSSSNFTDLSALLAFKSEIKTNPNNVLVCNWTETESFCNWVRVSCSRKRQRVTALSLTGMGLQDNNLSGTIPSTIKGMKSLHKLDLNGNQLEQSIPTKICLIANLGLMVLQNNKLSGPIPCCIGNIFHLQIMFLSSNALSSSIPSSLWSPENMLFLNLSSNSLEGNLHVNMKALKMLQCIDLYGNRISGKIPTVLGDFQSLSILNLSKNSFSGAIPEQLGDLITLDYLDLSHNNLSGEIPKSLVALSHLYYLNLSFNKLSGEIPRQGPFANFIAASFVVNEALCGQPIFQVPTCKNHSTGKPKAKYLMKIIFPIFAFTSILIVFILIMMRHQKNNVKTHNTILDVVPTVEHKLISYQELRCATNDFSEAKILGVESFGSVFKGILSKGTLVAVNVRHEEFQFLEKG